MRIKKVLSDWMPYNFVLMHNSHLAKKINRNKTKQKENKKNLKWNLYIHKWNDMEI